MAIAYKSEPKALDGSISVFYMHSNINTEVTVSHKNGKVIHNYFFSHSCSAEEIYKYLTDKHPNKVYTYSIVFSE